MANHFLIVIIKIFSTMIYTRYQVILSIIYYIMYYMRGSYGHLYYIYMVVCHPHPLPVDYIVVYCLSLILKNKYIVIINQQYRINIGHNLFTIIVSMSDNTNPCMCWLEHWFILNTRIICICVCMSAVGS